jgi:hypothetical protein
MVCDLGRCLGHYQMCLYRRCLRSSQADVFLSCNGSRCLPLLQCLSHKHSLSGFLLEICASKAETFFLFLQDDMPEFFGMCRDNDFQRSMISALLRYKLETQMLTRHDPQKK